MFSYLNAKNVSCNPKYTNDWIKSPTFITGVIIFFIGFIINVWADIKLRLLKKKSNEKKENSNEEEIENFENKENNFYEDGKFNFNKMFDSDVYFSDICKKHYYLPEGGLYDLVSSPNYLGEILEWSGWAIATWSMPGLLFALGAVGCIGVRSIHTHKWYKDCFEDYPKSRKALIPFIL